MKLDFDGMDELRKHLSSLSNVEEVEKRALKKAGEHMVTKLEENVYSYGLKRRTGTSAKSFLMDNKIVDGSISVGLSNQNSDAFYLYFHEYGTSRMPARPFMRPTFEKEKANIERIIANEVRKGIRA